MEDEMITAIDIQQTLQRLDPQDRELIQLAFRFELPPGYEGAPWPMSLSDVGRYWGLRWHGHEFSEAAIRYKRDAVITRWREFWKVTPTKPAKIRKNRKKS